MYCEWIEEFHWLRKPSNDFEGYCVYYDGILKEFDLLILCISPRDPRFVGSNPAEVEEFFQDVKILNTSPQVGTLSPAS